MRTLRRQWDIRPVYKMVDTCAAEFEAQTPYFYSTYEQENEADPIPASKAIVIGSGPIRIGQGIEFDYCSVHAAWALQREGIKSILVNSNPETVSTDFDTSDRLYFEPLDEESVRDIIENEVWDHDDGEAVGTDRRGPADGRAVWGTDGDQPLAGARPGQASHPRLDGGFHRHGIRQTPLRGVSGAVSEYPIRRARRSRPWNRR